MSRPRGFVAPNGEARSWERACLPCIEGAVCIYWRRSADP
jgi:hypothetical protein